MTARSGRRNIVAAAVKGLGLSLSADQLLALPRPVREEFGRWLVDFAGKGRALEQEMIRALARAIAPARGRPPKPAAGIIEAVRRRPLSPGKKVSRGAPHLIDAAARRAYVRAVDAEIAKQSRAARGGRAGAIRAAVVSLARRRRLDLARADTGVRRYRRWAKA